MEGGHSDLENKLGPPDRPAEPSPPRTVTRSVRTWGGPVAGKACPPPGGGRSPACPGALASHAPGASGGSAICLDPDLPHRGHLNVSLPTNDGQRPWGEWPPETGTGHSPVPRAASLQSQLCCQLWWAPRYRSCWMSPSSGNRRKQVRGSGHRGKAPCGPALPAALAGKEPHLTLAFPCKVTWWTTTSMVQPWPQRDTRATLCSVGPTRTVSSGQGLQRLLWRRSPRTKPAPRRQQRGWASPR